MLEDDIDSLPDAPSDTQNLRSLFTLRQGRSSFDTKEDKELVSRILEQARKIVRHPSKPQTRQLALFSENPFHEIALEETLEQFPLIDLAEDSIIEYQADRPFSCVALLDTSLSMTGEKQLLSSVAVAVLLLEAEVSQSSLIVFSSGTKVIQPLGVQASPAKTILEFIQHRPKGFTNLSLGLEAGLQQYSQTTAGKRKVAVIVTDGRTTEGPDPIPIARRYDALIVLHLHGPGSHLEASKQLAQAGNGLCLEVETMEKLPKRMYEAVRTVARL